jgi:hypothetical protein
MPPSLKGKGRRRRSKSPKVKKTKVETRAEIPPKPPKPVEEVEFVEPTKSEEIGIVSDRDATNDRVSTSGLTNDEMHAILKQKISELHELERQFVGAREPLRHTAPPKPARESRAPKAPIPRDVTPGRIAAENFFEKLCAVLPQLLLKLNRRLPTRQTVRVHPRAMTNLDHHGVALRVSACRRNAGVDTLESRRCCLSQFRHRVTTVNLTLMLFSGLHANQRLM